MNVGIVYPTPGPQGSLDGEFLKRMKGDTHAQMLRFNLDYDNPDWRQLMDTALSAGWIPFPIIDVSDYAAINITKYATFAKDVCKEYRSQYVELLNEPSILHGMTPQAYAKLVRETSSFISPICPWIVVAGEMMEPEKNGPKPKGWWKDMRSALGVGDASLYDGVALHPYREPGPPNATWFTTRRQEMRHWRSQISGMTAVFVTEVGWREDTLDEAKQAAYTFQELAINAELGVLATFIYAHIGPGFGIYANDQRPRPVVESIRRFIDDGYPIGPSNDTWLARQLARVPNPMTWRLVKPDPNV